MKLLILIGAILLNFNLLSAQDDRLDEFTFEEQQFDQKKVYFGVGGGYSGSFFIQDMTDINQFLQSKDLGLEDFKDNIYHHGLELMSSTIIIPNTRIGFFRYSGSSEITGNVEINSTNYNRAVKISNFSTGVPLEYAFMPFKSFAIIPSIAMGYGTYDIDITQNISSIDINNLNDPNTTYENIATSYWFAMPRLHIEYAFTQFTVIRLSAFYMTTFAQDWQYNKSTTLDNVPTGFNPNGYAIQIGLFVGLFNY